MALQRDSKFYCAAMYGLSSLVLNPLPHKPPKNETTLNKKQKSKKNKTKKQKTTTKNDNKETLTFFYKGPEFWLTDWRVLLFMPSWLADQLPAIEFREFCCYFFSVLPMTITAIFKCVNQGPTPNTRSLTHSPSPSIYLFWGVPGSVRSVLLHVKEKGKPVGPAVGQIFTFIIYFGMVVIWYLSSNRLWRENPHPLHMAVGVGFAEMTVSLLFFFIFFIFFNLPIFPFIERFDSCTSL